MYRLIYIILIFLSCFSLHSQTSNVYLDANIDTDLFMSSKMVFESSIPIDTIKIFKSSAGRDINGKPNIKILNISVNDEQHSLKETEKWFFIDNVGANDKVEIIYKLDLKAIYDWRESYGYQIFPGTYEDKCWYPDIYVDNKRDFHKDFYVEIRHNSKLQLLTSGNLVQKKEKNDKDIVSSYRAENLRYFGLNAAYGFVTNTISNGSVTLSYFCPKSKEKEYKEVAETAMEAINWYTSKYGFFPKKTMGLAIGHPKWHGGFPSENMFYIHQGNLDKSFVQWITAHELGHYYWGLHTFSATEDELSPLMLSNGIWIDHLYLSEVYGKSFTEIWNRYSPQAAMIEKYLATYLANFEQEIGFTRDQQNFGFDYNSNVAHSKAAVGIYLLSQLIGIESYLELQKEILNTFKGKSFSIEDFTSLLKQRGYESASLFLKAWYKDHAFIEYGIYRLKIEEEDSQWHYSFELRKKGTVDFPVDISIVTQDGKTYKFISNGTSKKQIFEGITKSKPLRFLLDADGKLPMWNSDNNAVQKVYIFALYRAGKLKMANALAKEALKEDEDKRLQLYYETYKY